MLLEVRALHTAVLHSVALTLAAGECVALSGPSGSGKTVLLRALADLDPNQGVVTLEGAARERFAPAQWRHEVALVPAEPAWWEARVGEHFPAPPPVPLSRLGLPEEALDWEVARCSSGERQRLAILRALAMKPRVLLLDEATANLDAANRGRVEDLIEDFRRAGGGVLWVTHDEEQAARIAQRRLWVHEGRLQEAPGMPA